VPETPDRSLVGSHNDWARQPLAALVWWCVPIAIGVSSSLLGLPLRAAAWVWAASLAWMAAGCLLNARRCHRLHCYISGPVLLLGAGAAVSLASGFIDLGPHALNNVVSVTFVLALLSFAPEFLWKRYV
jgi:hypothetical protein